MANNNLTSAKKAKNDEFYTQYHDIQKEIEAYIEYDPDVFRGKVVYCNCDDPFESNFFRYFANKFNELGLKKLITTSYAGSSIVNTQLQLPAAKDDNVKATQVNNKIAYRIEINSVADLTKDGITNLDDVKWLLQHDTNACIRLKGDGKYAAGDFRSQECIDLLKQSDIVVTNPPFSLFREYVSQLVNYQKKFVIIGNLNAITYKEIFPIIKNNKVWLGPSITSGDREFVIPKENVDIAKFTGEIRKDQNGNDVYYQKVVGVRWYTNIDHGRRHQPIPLMTMAENLKFNKKLKGKDSYDHYDNYAAIEVPYTTTIPTDYDGVMGVPISFLDKYSPEQFTILGATESEGKGFSNGLWLQNSGVSQPLVDGKRVYKRLFIKHRKDAKR